MDHVFQAYRFASVDDLASAFEEKDVAPLAVELAEALAPPHNLEANALVQTNTALVLGEDASLDRPDAGGFGAGDQLLE
jgi:hypothetical protein